MFINLSNHPSSKWSEAQTEAAKQYGDIIDLTFPQVDPNGDEAYIANLADEYCRKTLDMGDGTPLTIHLMGEMTLAFALVARLKAKGVVCLASTTERIVLEEKPGVKTNVFRFARFRRY